MAELAVLPVRPEPWGPSGLSYGYGPSLSDEARSRTRDHVRAIARLMDGEQVAITRTTSYGAQVADVEGLSGLEAAVRVRDVAAGLVREYAIAARGEGARWDSVGAALGLGELLEETGEDLSEAAFLFVTAGRMPEVAADRSAWRSSVAWTCVTCGARVVDHGPFDAHPDHAEPGHAEDCGRRARALACLRSPWSRESPASESRANGGTSGRW